MNGTYCVHAERSLNVGISGDTKICCMSKKLFTKNGKIIRSTKDSIKDAWNSQDRIEIVEALKSGVKHANCDLCWREENAGIASKRIRDNARYNLEPLKDQPVIMDLNMGNICNLKCRTCGSHSSSKWLQEEMDVYNKKPAATQVLQCLPDNFQDNESWSVLQSWSNNLKFIDFYGGEPMLLKKHWHLLEKSVADGSSQHQVLHYNTNGTIFPEDKLDLFRKFKGFDLSLSLDGVDKSFEYIRHPASWKAVKENCLRWKKFTESLDIEIKELSICLTISLINIFDLDKIYTELKELNINIYFNLVHEPKHFNISNMPNNFKETVVKKLEESISSSESHPMSVILNFMKQGVPQDKEWTMFITTIKKHDRYRKESFADVFPEYYRLIESSFLQVVLEPVFGDKEIA